MAMEASSTSFSDRTGENNSEATDALLSKARELRDKIISSQHNPNPNPNPRLIHALASLLEDEESRFIQEFGQTSFQNVRASSTIGRLGSVLRENDELLDLVASKFLTDGRFTLRVRAASARLTLACSTSWMYPHILDDEVIENIKQWVMDDSLGIPTPGSHAKEDRHNSLPSDVEMLKTYSTGLLSIALSGGGQLIEDVLMCGLSAKLMRYLRLRVLGESNVSQKTPGHISETKHAGVSSSRREESNSKFRQIDSARLDVAKPGSEGLFSDRNVHRNLNRGLVLKLDEDEPRADSGMDSADTANFYAHRENEADLSGEDVRDETSRRIVSRLGASHKGKERISEGLAESEKLHGFPAASSRAVVPGRNPRARNQTRAADSKRTNSKNDSRKPLTNTLVPEETDSPPVEIMIGTQDISHLVKKAREAAETEACSALASIEAIKAAGDAAAELVRTAALEVFDSTNDEASAVKAAAKAASSVVEAAKVIQISRDNSMEDVMLSSKLEPEEDEIEGFVILDIESLAKLREKYCILCMQQLGEYVEVLAPVLHEKGVDVCLSLLQRCNKFQESAESLSLLSDVLKLICSLAAHRKFAALFVDRGGMQKLLAVRRIPHTFPGLSSCLFAIGSLQGIMERVCALPPEVVQQVVELALQLLECSQDQARKNAALFFSSAFVFKAVLDSFERQDGLQKLLKLLGAAASVRSGGNSGSTSLSGLSSFRNDRAPTEVLTASEKQIAFHTSVALRQYFRAHLLLLIDSLRPNKGTRGVTRSLASSRAAYKPLDISSEAMDAVFLQLQRDRKLGPAFAKVRWAPAEKFMAIGGHTTLLELCQAPPVDRYLHDLAQYALGVLHIITLGPNHRKTVITAPLSNDRVGMAVILDAANGAGYGDPEVIQPALNVLVNLVCPPPSLSSKLTFPQGQQNASSQAPSGPAGTENKERHNERIVSDRERNGEPATSERGGAPVPCTPAANTGQQSTPFTSGFVGDRRISLGSGTGFAGLATSMEQAYRQAWEAVRANNGIKVLLHLLHPRILIPPASLDCVRALACRVLLGLARDETIAQILTKLQVGKLLSELIRDSGNQSSMAEQGRWQSELAQVAMELIAIVTNAGRASTLAATDAAAPTLRRMERAAIAAATPISYHAKELLLLIHEHLVASGMTTTAHALVKEAQLSPLLLPSSTASHPALHQIPTGDASVIEMRWPSRSSVQFLSAPKLVNQSEEALSKRYSSAVCLKKKPSFSLSLGGQLKTHPPGSPLSTSKSFGQRNLSVTSKAEDLIISPRPSTDIDANLRTPMNVGMKRKLPDRDLAAFIPSAKRMVLSDHEQPQSVSKTPTCSQTDNLDDFHSLNTPSLQPVSMSHHSLMPDSQLGNERVTLDSLVVQYLKHQHRQCQAPITTLPPLSLLQPHSCPEPSRNLEIPLNITARLAARESRNQRGILRSHRRDRQFVFSRFRPCRTCRDEAALLTCISFFNDASRIVTGSHSGEIKIFDTSNGNVLENHLCHQSQVMLVQSAPQICKTWSENSDPGPLLLSSGSFDVKLWDSSSLTSGPLHSFENCKAAHFDHTGRVFAAVSTESSRREILLYDVESRSVTERFSDSSLGSSRSHVQSIIHFSPSDEMILFNGVLWDRRLTRPIHRFDQFTDYGGGGFHPAGNEVIINSEVWDLRKFKLLRSVPSLDQTIINFNAGGDIIYAILRRNLDDIASAVHTRKLRHPLFAAFRTLDAVNYSDIATIPVDRCVLDFATEPTDSFIGVVAMDDHEDMFSSARLYEIGRRRSTDDDSDPDDGVETDDEDEDDDDDSEVNENAIVAGGLDDGDIDLSNDDDDDDDSGDDLDDAEFNTEDEEDFDEAATLLELVTDDDDDGSHLDVMSSDDEGEFHNLHDLNF